MKDIAYWRFALGRWLMHLGLNVMPRGRSRRELETILTSWSRHVKETMS